MTVSNREVLAVIPARLNSKSVRHKVIRAFGGHPLISYMIQAALGASAVTRTIVTTESLEIAEIASSYGAEIPFMRPAYLAEDGVETDPVVKHAVAELERLEGYKPDLVVWLQPTSPLCLSEDIDGAINLFLQEEALFVMSVSPMLVHPYLATQMDDEGRLSSFIELTPEVFSVGRQKYPPVYQINGAVFVTGADDLSVPVDDRFSDRTFGYVMPVERSVDINTELDLKVAELLLAEREEAREKALYAEHAISGKL